MHVYARKHEFTLFAGLFHEWIKTQHIDWYDGRAKSCSAKTIILVYIYIYIYIYMRIIASIVYNCIVVCTPLVLY